MIPYLYNASFKCGSCHDEVSYDSSLSERTPRICARCKIDRIAKRDLARREKLKAQTAEISGRELDRYAVRTHKQVGEILGVSEESVRKTERSALAKLRRAIDAANKKIFRQ